MRFWQDLLLWTWSLIPLKYRNTFKFCNFNTPLFYFSMKSNLAVAHPETALSLAQYHALERTTDRRHEYYDGKVIAMAGVGAAIINLANN